VAASGTAARAVVVVTRKGQAMVGVEEGAGFTVFVMYVVPVFGIFWIAWAIDKAGEKIAAAIRSQGAPGAEAPDDAPRGIIGPDPSDIVDDDEVL